MKDKSVSWQGNQLSGQLNKVPIQGLLEDLLQSGGDKWQVIGDLKGVVSIRFDHLTIEECIQKVLRQGNYNYTLIQSEPQPSDVEWVHTVRELAIYIDDTIVRFRRTVWDHSTDSLQNAERNAPSDPSMAIAADPSDSQSREGIKSVEQAHESGIQKDEMPEEILKFVNQLFKDKKISKEEYEKTLSNFSDGIK